MNTTTETFETELVINVDGRHDLLKVLDADGETIDSVLVTSTEDEAPYLQALTANGWRVAGRHELTGQWIVAR